MHPDKHPRVSHCVSLVGGDTPTSISGHLSVYAWWRSTHQQASSGVSVCIPGGGIHPSKHPRASKCVSPVEGCTSAGWGTFQQASRGLSVCILGGGIHLSGYPRAAECVSLAEGCAPRSIQGSLTVYPWWGKGCTPTIIPKHLSVYAWWRSTHQQASSDV
jgi:hypothetical protein